MSIHQFFKFIMIIAQFMHQTQPSISLPENTHDNPLQNT
jgi:hypothetical protein